MKKKVFIDISSGHHYHKSVDNVGGMPFISVDYGERKDGRAAQYVGACPCNNEKEVQHAVKHAKEVIIKDGDIPIIRDFREDED